MTRFKHDLILRIIKILDAVLVTVPFALCWYLYYAKHIASPFYAKGDYLVVALFLVLFIIFGRVYDALLMSMQRISEIVYAQFLAVAVSDFIMYIVIWLLSKHLPNILPGVAAVHHSSRANTNRAPTHERLVFFMINSSDDFFAACRAD